MVEREIVFTSGGVRLRGTLGLPESEPPFPCVLMLVGSGRVDRDENQRAFRLNVMNALAAALVEHGIASFRYDKRGVGASEGDFWRTGFFDNVTDAQAALVFLRAQPLVDAERIFLLGHSEGAYIATRLAASVPAAQGVGSPEACWVAGVILLAGGARRVEDELMWQGQRVAETLAGFSAWVAKTLRIDLSKRQAKQLERVKRSHTDWYRATMTKVNAKWFREVLAYDPQEDLVQLGVPILAITGEKDIQVDPGNLARMRQLVRAPFEAHVVPDLTHLLRREEGPPGLATYRKQAKRPLDPRVPTLIVEWLERHGRRDGC